MLRCPSGSLAPFMSGAVIGRVGVREVTSQEDGQGSIVDVERVPQLAQADFVALGKRAVGGLERDVLQRLQQRL